MHMSSGDCTGTLSLSLPLAARCFRDGVLVFDEQMHGLQQLLALPEAPLSWSALAAGQWLPCRVKAPPPLWQAPRRVMLASAALR
jgi:hypothetical protein